MARRTLAAAVTLCALLAPAGTAAREPGGPRGPGGGWARCAGPEDLALSAEQQHAVDRAEQAYGGTIRTLRNQGTSRRLELQELLADPAAGEEAIRARSKELIAVQAELQRTLLEYQLRVRAVLSPDQLARWCGGPMRRRGGGWGACIDP